LRSPPIYPDEYAELVTVQPPPSVQEMARVERERFATDHNELGAALLADWHLPRLFVVSVFHHEAPEQARLPEGSREFIICQVLHLAARFGDLCVSPEPARAHLLPDLILGAAKVGLDEAALSKLTDEVVAQWREWGKILEVHTQAVPAFEILSQQKSAAPVMREPDKLPDPRTVQSLTVLIVDDDRATLMLVEHLLKALGHKVHTAQDGRSALAQAMSIRPQIIISDWIMPGLDGVSFCKALRQTEEGQQIYFIILSALEQDDQLVEAFESGVDDYLTKPFTARVPGSALRAGQRVSSCRKMRAATARICAALRRARGRQPAPAAGRAHRSADRAAEPTLRDGAARAGMGGHLAHAAPVDLAWWSTSIGFKQINDSYGHDSGDVVLRQVATCCARKRAPRM
jgi:DNA-binding response OmpR family regulator